MGMTIKAALALAGLAISASPAMAQVSNAAQIGDWAYGDTADAMTDIRGGIAITFDKESGASLSVMCRISMKENPILFIITYPKREHIYTDFAHITFRVDGKDVFPMLWYNSDGERAMVYSKSDMRKLYENMASAKSLKARIKKQDEGFFDIAFSVGGAKEAVDRVFTSCGKPVLTAR